MPGLHPKPIKSHGSGSGGQERPRIGGGAGGAFILSSAHGINRLPELRTATLGPSNTAFVCRRA